MKKNKMMRLASCLLVLVMLSTSMISGTFAKYVTSADASDSARVAKFGVVATVTGNAFASEYAIKAAATDVDGNNIEYSVKSSTGDDVVAPGTNGTFTGVALTGQPEVAVNVKNEAAITLEGWTLAGGVFYCPITVTIEGTPISGLDYTSAADFITALEGAIEAANGNYAPNTDLATIGGLNGNYEWEWAFDGDDGKDTELGNQAARGTLNKITISVDTTVTQID